MNQTKNEKVFPAGVNCFSGQKDFILADVVINVKEFYEWIKANHDYLTEYKGNKQLRLQVLKGKEKPYMAVNTWKPKEQPAPAPQAANNIDDDLPF